jgi:hypothetical protein
VIVARKPDAVCVDPRDALDQLAIGRPWISGQDHVTDSRRGANDEQPITRTERWLHRATPHLDDVEASDCPRAEGGPGRDADECRRAHRVERVSRGAR